MTRHLLATAGTGINGFRDFVSLPVMNEAKAHRLPPVRQGAGVDNGRWVKDLESLSQYLGWAQTAFRTRENIADVDAPDKGGNTNLYRRLYRPARWWLVNEGWHLYEIFKPGEATGTEGGPFHLFLCAVFEFATGQSPEEHSRLSHWLKTLTKLNRGMVNNQVTTSQLEEERDALLQGKNASLTVEAREARLNEINAELFSLQRESSEIRAQLNP